MGPASRVRPGESTGGEGVKAGPGEGIRPGDRDGVSEGTGANDGARVVGPKVPGVGTGVRAIGGGVRAGGVRVCGVRVCGVRVCGVTGTNRVCGRMDCADAVAAKMNSPARTPQHNGRRSDNGTDLEDGMRSPLRPSARQRQDLNVFWRKIVLELGGWRLPRVSAILVRSRWEARG